MPISLVKEISTGVAERQSPGNASQMSPTLEVVPKNCFMEYPLPNGEVFELSFFSKEPRVTRAPRKKYSKKRSMTEGQQEMAREIEFSLKGIKMESKVKVDKKPIVNEEDEEIDSVGKKQEATYSVPVVSDVDNRFGVTKKPPAGEEKAAGKQSNIDRKTIGSVGAKGVDKKPIVNKEDEAIEVEYRQLMKELDEALEVDSVGKKRDETYSVPVVTDVGNESGVIKKSPAGEEKPAAKQSNMDNKTVGSVGEKGDVADEDYSAVVAEVIVAGAVTTGVVKLSNRDKRTTDVGSARGKGDGADEKTRDVAHAAPDTGSKPVVTNVDKQPARKQPIYKGKSAGIKFNVGTDDKKFYAGKKSNVKFDKRSKKVRRNANGESVGNAEGMGDGAGWVKQRSRRNGATLKNNCDIVEDLKIFNRFEVLSENEEPEIQPVTKLSVEKKKKPRKVKKGKNAQISGASIPGLNNQSGKTKKKSGGLSGGTPTNGKPDENKEVSLNFKCRFKNPDGPHRNTCFANAGVSLLLNVEPFRKEIEQTTFDPTMTVSNEMKKLVVSTKEIMSTVPLRKEVGTMSNINFNDNEQHDSSELVIELLGLMKMESRHGVEVQNPNEESKESMINAHFDGNIVSKNFDLLVKNTLTCQDGHERFSYELISPCVNVEAFTIVDENQHERFVDLESCIKNHFKEEIITVNCGEFCDKKQMRQTKEVVNSPNFVIFNIKRSVMTNGVEKKLNHAIDLPPKLNLRNDTYRLSSYTCHIGPTRNTGHYVTVLCKGNREVLCNDSQVRDLVSKAERKNYRDMATMACYEKLKDTNLSDSKLKTKQVGGRVDTGEDSKLDNSADEGAFDKVNAISLIEKLQALNIDDENLEGVMSMKHELIGSSIEQLMRLLMEFEGKKREVYVLANDADNIMEKLTKAGMSEKVSAKVRIFRRLATQTTEFLNSMSEVEAKKSANLKTDKKPGPKGDHGHQESKRAENKESAQTPYAKGDAMNEEGKSNKAQDSFKVPDGKGEAKNKRKKGSKTKDFSQTFDAKANTMSEVLIEKLEALNIDDENFEGVMTMKHKLIGPSIEQLMQLLIEFEGKQREVIVLANDADNIMEKLTKAGISENVSAKVKIFRKLATQTTEFLNSMSEVEAKKSANLKTPTAKGDAMNEEGKSSKAQESFQVPDGKGEEKNKGQRGSKTKDFSQTFDAKANTMSEVFVNGRRQNEYYKFFKVKGDGHCLFTSIGQSLPNKLSVGEVRRKIYQEGLSNVKYYSQLLDVYHNIYGNEAEFEKLMRHRLSCVESGTIVWGDNIDIVLATQVLKRDIYVYYSQENKTRAFSFQKGKLHSSNFIVLHYDGVNHYEIIKMHEGTRPRVTMYYSWAPHHTKIGEGNLYRYKIVNGNPVLLDRETNRSTAPDDNCNVNVDEDTDIPSVKRTLSDESSLRNSVKKKSKTFKKPPIVITGTPVENEEENEETLKLPTKELEEMSNNEIIDLFKINNPGFTGKIQARKQLIKSLKLKIADKVINRLSDRIISDQLKKLSGTVTCKDNKRKALIKLIIEKNVWLTVLTELMEKMTSDNAVSKSDPTVKVDDESSNENKSETFFKQTSENVGFNNVHKDNDGQNSEESFLFLQFDNVENLSREELINIFNLNKIDIPKDKEKIAKTNRLKTTLKSKLIRKVVSRLSDDVIRDELKTLGVAVSKKSKTVCSNFITLLQKSNDWLAMLKRLQIRCVANPNEGTEDLSNKPSPTRKATPSRKRSQSVGEDSRRKKRLLDEFPSDTTNPEEDIGAEEPEQLANLNRKEGNSLDDSKLQHEVTGEEPQSEYNSKSIFEKEYVGVSLLGIVWPEKPLKKMNRKELNDVCIANKIKVLVGHKSITQVGKYIVKKLVSQIVLNLNDREVRLVLELFTNKQISKVRNIKELIGRLICVIEQYTDPIKALQMLEKLIGERSVIEINKYGEEVNVMGSQLITGLPGAYINMLDACDLFKVCQSNQINSMDPTWNLTAKRNYVVAELYRRVLCVSSIEDIRWLLEQVKQSPVEENLSRAMLCDNVITIAKNIRHSLSLLDKYHERITGLRCLPQETDKLGIKLPQESIDSLNNVDDIIELCRQNDIIALARSKGPTAALNRFTAHLTDRLVNYMSRVSVVNYLDELQVQYDKKNDRKHQASTLKKVVKNLPEKDAVLRSMVITASKDYKEFIVLPKKNISEMTEKDIETSNAENGFYGIEPLKQLINNLTERLVDIFDDTTVTEYLTSLEIPHEQLNSKERAETLKRNVKKLESSEGILRLMVDMATNNFEVLIRLPEKKFKDLSKEEINSINMDNQFTVVDAMKQHLIICLSDKLMMKMSGDGIREFYARMHGGAKAGKKTRREQCLLIKCKLLETENPFVHLADAHTKAVKDERPFSEFQNYIDIPNEEEVADGIETLREIRGRVNRQYCDDDFDQVEQKENPLIEGGKMMHQKLEELFQFPGPCIVCKENFPENGVGVAGRKQCNRCRWERKDHPEQPHKFSAGNNMDPGVQPPELSGLTVVEQSCISRQYCQMSISRKRFGGTKLKGHTMCFDQDIQDLVNVLPRRPEELNIIFIAAPQNRNIVLKADRNKILTALRWLKENNCEYRNIEISEENLALYPEGRNVVAGIRTVDMDPEQMTDQPDVMPGPAEDSTEPIATEEGRSVEDDVDDAEKYPCSTLPMVVNQETIAASIVEGVLGQGTTEKNPVDWPARGLPANEKREGFLTRCFPWLYPTGAGDFTRPRYKTVNDFLGYIRHCLYYEGGRFAKDERWLFYMINRYQRNLALSAGNVYAKANLADMTGKELKENLASKDKDTYRKTIQCLMRFGKALKGTRQDLANLANKSIAMLQFVQNASHDTNAFNLFLTLSAADLHWPTFHKAFPEAEEYLNKQVVDNDIHIPADKMDEYIKKSDDYIKRQKLVNENAPAFNYFFCRRWELLVEYVLKKKLGLKDFFVRFEFQNRTVIHVHSFLFIPSNISAESVKEAFSWAPEAQLKGSADNNDAVKEWIKKALNQKIPKDTSKSTAEKDVEQEFFDESEIEALLNAAMDEVIPQLDGNMDDSEEIDFESGEDDENEMNIGESAATPTDAQAYGFSAEKLDEMGEQVTDVLFTMMKDMANSVVDDAVEVGQVKEIEKELTKIFNHVLSEEDGSKKPNFREVVKHKRDQVLDFAIRTIGITDMCPEQLPINWPPPVGTGFKPTNDVLRKQFSEAVATPELAKEDNRLLVLKVMIHLCMHFYCRKDKKLKKKIEDKKNEGGTAKEGEKAEGNKETEKRKNVSPPLEECRFGMPFDPVGFQYTFREENGNDVLDGVIRNPAQLCLEGGAFGVKDVPRDEPTENESDDLHPCSEKPEQVFLKFLRNHPTLVRHTSELLSIWRANIEIKIIRTNEEILHYLTKYTLKPESSSAGLRDTITTVLSKSNDEDAAKTIAQKILMKTIIEHDFSKNEISHIANGRSIVEFSRIFLFFNLLGSKDVRLRGDDEVATVDGLPEIYKKRSTDPHYLRFVEEYESADLNLKPSPKAPKDISLYWFISHFEKNWEPRDKLAVPMAVPFIKRPPKAENKELCIKYFKTKLILFKPDCHLEDLEGKDDKELREMFVSFIDKDPNAPKSLVDEYYNNQADTEVIQDIVPEIREDPDEQDEQDDWMKGLGREQKKRDPNLEDEESGDEDEEEDRADDSSEYGDIDTADFDWTTDLKRFNLEDEDKRKVANWLHDQQVRSGFKGREEDENEVIVDPDTLNENQSRLFRTLMKHIELRRSDPEVEPIYVDLAGAGGTGKTYVLNCLIQKVRELALEEEVILTCAPTGTAASLLPRGSKTIHTLLNIPINRSFKKPLEPMSPERKKEMQLRFEKAVLLVIDEKSMLSFDMLYMIDARLRELIPGKKTEYFGGLSILLQGDYGQLPSVNGDPLYCAQPKSNKENIYVNMGFNAFRKFDKCFTLQQNERQAGDENKEFRDMLEGLKTGKFSKAQWDLLETRSYDQLSEEERQHYDENASMLSARKKDMLGFNKRKLRECHEPIAHLLAVHNRESCAHLTSDKAGGLQPDMWICNGARVVLTQNLWTERKLVNGSVGTVVGILYWENEKPPTLPIVLVEFKGYTGPSFLPDRPNVVPICPSTREFRHNKKSTTRTMTPLLLGWGITIHKAQGMTLKEIFIRLGNCEFAAGLTYTAMSRVRSLDKLCFWPLGDFSRFYSIFAKNKFKRRLYYEENIRPPLEKNFMDYSKEILGETDDDEV